eukprot:scaffold259099_cov35-Prasinocladus_malaysianus.AAC.4
MDLLKFNDQMVTGRNPSAGPSHISKRKRAHSGAEVVFDPADHNWSVILSCNLSEVMLPSVQRPAENDQRLVLLLQGQRREGILDWVQQAQEAAKKGGDEVSMLWCLTVINNCFGRQFDTAALSIGPSNGDMQCQTMNDITGSRMQLEKLEKEDKREQRAERRRVKKAQMKQRTDDKLQLEMSDDDDGGKTEKIPNSAAKDVKVYDSGNTTTTVVMSRIHNSSSDESEPDANEGKVEDNPASSASATMFVSSGKHQPVKKRSKILAKMKEKASKTNSTSSRGAAHQKKKKIDKRSEHSNGRGKKSSTKTKKKGRR